MRARRNRPGRGRLQGAQRGAALILMVAILALGASWYLVDSIALRSGNFTAAKRQHNAQVLQRAKQALIGYVAAQAGKTNEDNPGALPCPEAAGYYGSDTQEGQAAGTCTLPKVGRFPWRTVGTEKLFDADGEPLWYVVASGWANSGSNTLINSECANSASGLACYSGQLTVDGVANDAVALIIAPGAPLIVSASSSCTARTQTRSTSSIDWRDYLECENATSPADASFVTTGPSGSFNDQVVKIGVGELLPAIEGGVASRFITEFATGMKNAYTNANSANSSWPATLPVLPYPAPFGTGPSASTFQGSAGTTGGLLPLSYATTGACGTACTPTLCTAGSSALCDPTFVRFAGAAPTLTRNSGATIYTPGTSCTVASAQITCTILIYRTGTTSGNSRITLTFSNITAYKVGAALRQLNVSVLDTPGTGFDTSYTGETLTGVLNTDANASATLTLRHRLPNGATQLADSACGLSNSSSNWCWRHNVVIPIQILSDHPLVDPTDKYTWFTRNQWHYLSYYAVASNIAPSGSRSCQDLTTYPTTTIPCLTLSYTSSSDKKRGLVVIGGRKFSNQTRPAVALTDLFEGANLDGASPFEPRSATLRNNPMIASQFTSAQAFSDRVAVIDSNP